MRALHLRWIAVGHPAQIVVVLFASVIVVGTALLMLPIATEGSGTAGLSTALFTATSAICVTGLIVVDTPTYWSGFGEWTILVLIQLGGIGIMTLASLLTMLLTHRLGLRQRLTTLAETGAVPLGDLRSVLRRVIVLTAIAEAAGAIILTIGFFAVTDVSALGAVRLGVFHSISAWNNAGFALFSDNLAGFADEPLVLIPIAVLVIVGGLGLPVLADLKHNLRAPERWSLHSRITVAGTVALLVLGTAVFTAFEWTNGDTLGPLSIPAKLLNGGFASVMPRTAGFNAIDIGGLESSSKLFHTFFMFVGAGSSSTAGGIKVSTLVVVVLIVWAEMRGHEETSGFSRAIPAASQRQAVTVIAGGMAAVFIAVSVLLAVDHFTFEDSVFEAFSAFGTVGLSTGITPMLGLGGRIVIIALMFLGRLGPITLGTALLLRNRPRKFRLPDEAPLIG